MGTIVGVSVALLLLLGAAGAVAFVVMNPHLINPTQVADLDTSTTGATEKEKPTEKEKDTAKGKDTTKAGTAKETRKDDPGDKPPADEPLDPAARDKVKKVSVVIRGPLGDNLSDVVRTGFFIDPAGVLITSAQGLQINTGGALAPAVDVTMNPGEADAKLVTGTVIDTSPDLNLVMLQVKREHLPPMNFNTVKLAPASNVRPKQTLYAIAPGNLGFTAEPLTVLAVTPAKVKGTYQLRVQGKLGDTASGAPVMTGAGLVIGVVSVGKDGPTVMAGEVFPETVAGLMAKYVVPSSRPEAKPLVEVRRFEGHTGTVFSVAISQDGKVAVSGGADKTVRVWDVETGKIIKTLEGHGDEVHGVAITPDGKRIVSGSYDRTVRVWDIATGREGQRLQPLGIKPEFLQRVSAVAISPDGAYAAATDEVNTWLWDMKSSMELDHFKISQETLAFTRDSKSLVVGGVNHLWVWGGFSGIL